MKSSDVLSAPLTVNWSLSYRCNFTCTHCYSRELEKAQLPMTDITSVVDILAGKGVVYVNFGGGEPLLVDKLFDITAYAVSKGLNVSMNTNGWMLDAGSAERIADSGFHRVGVSIDSPEPPVHDAFRNREGSFARAVRALDHLRDAGVRSTVSCVISRLNLHTWQGMVDLCLEHGAGTLYLHNYKCAGPGRVNTADLDPSPSEWSAFYSEALEVKDAVSSLSISFDDPIMAALPGYQADAVVSGSTCGKLSLHIEPDGGITPCGFIPVAIGNILEDDFDSIWFGSPVLEKMRSKTATGKCLGCESYDACLGGCTARSFAVTGRFDSPDPHCWVQEIQSKTQNPKSKGNKKANLKNR